MLRMSVANFSNFEVICNKAAMTKELKNNTIGYMRLGERVHPVIKIEVTYDTNYYRDVDIADKVVIPVAILGETPEDAHNQIWFDMNGVYADNREAYYDFIVPISDKWIYEDREEAKDYRIPSVKDLNKWPDLCEIVKDEDGPGTLVMYFSNKIVLNAVATTKELEAILPVLYYRQERFTYLKWNDCDDDMHPVMRFSEGKLIKYYAVVREHTESEFQRYAVHLKEIDENEVYPLFVD